MEPHVVERKEVHSIESGKDRTDFWHTDITFMKRPAMASMLRSVIVPEAGGDTMWADTRAAYDALAEPLQRLCDELTAFHFEPYYAQAVAEGHGNVWEGKKLTRLLPATHPVVSVHPETGRKNLYVNPKFTVRITDMSESQSAGLLRLLYDHMASPQFVVRYHWKPDTLAFWDNRSTMHFGIFDYDGTEPHHASRHAARRPTGRPGALNALAARTRASTTAGSESPLNDSGLRSLNGRKIPSRPVEPLAQRGGRPHVVLVVLEDPLLRRRTHRRARTPRPWPGRT